MTRSLTKRRTAAAIAAALALGIAAPAAGARPIDQGPWFHAGVPAPASATTSLVRPNPDKQLPATPPAATRPVTASGHNASDISDWGFVAIGSGVTALALISLGGTRAATRRRRQRATVQPEVAA